MLDLVRNLVSSIFGRVLLGIMILSFALWGVGDILSSGNSQLAAKVGNEKITLDDFYFEFQKSVQDYNQSTQSNITLKEAYEMQLHSSILNELVYTKMIKDYAKNKNIRINDQSLKIIIKDLPQFQNDKGLFSELKYKDFVYNNFRNEGEFLNQIENSIYQSVLFENFDIKNFMNRSIIDVLYNYEGEERSIKYFLLNEDLITVEENFELIQKYYNENKNDYLVNKKTIIDYIKIDIESFKDIENVTEQEARDYYNENKSIYIEAETRDIKFARFDKVDHAISFKKALKQKNQEVINEFIDNNNITLNYIDDYAGNTFPKNIDEAIFNLSLREVSEELEYDNIGFYVFQVMDISQEQIIDFKEAKKGIYNSLALEKAYIDYDNVINNADEMLINDFTFQEIADEISEKTEFTSVDIEDLKSTIPDYDFDYTESKPVGYISDIIFDENKFFIFTIKSKEDSYIPEINEIRDQLTNDYRKEAKKIELSSMAEKILIKIQFKDQEFFQKYAETNNYQLIEKDSISRSDKLFSKDTIDKIFDINEGNVLILELENNGIGIGIVNDVIKPGDTIKSDFYGSVAKNIKENFNNSLQNLIGNEVINNTDYQIYRQNIDNLFM